MLNETETQTMQDLARARCQCPGDTPDRLAAFTQGVRAGIEEIAPHVTLNGQAKPAQAPVAAPDDRAKLAVDVSCYTTHCVITTHGPYVQYLERCLRSVIEQTKPFRSVAIMHNGEKAEEAREIVMRLANECRKVTRLSFVPCETSNAGEKRNLGLDNDAECVVFVDGDDWLGKAFHAECMPYMADPAVGVVCPHLTHRGNVTGYKCATSPTYDDLCRENTVPVTCLVRREALDQAGGFATTAPYMKDWQTWLAVMALGWKVATAPLAELHYFHHDQNHSLGRSESGEGRKATAKVAELSKPLAIVTPFCGRDFMLSTYREALMDQCVNSRLTHVFLLDNSNDVDFHVRLVEDVAMRLMNSFASVTVHEVPHQAVEGISNAAVADGPEHIRKQYTKEIIHATAVNMNIIRKIVWCPDILLWEDDCIPEGNDAISKLRETMAMPWISRVSGMYMSRFADGPVAWGEAFSPIPLQRASATGKGRVPIYQTGFGFLLVRREVLQRHIFRQWPDSDHKQQGTDFSFARDCLELGEPCILRRDVRVRHYSQDGTYA